MGGNNTMEYISREKAEELLKKYNNDPFHLQHAYTVEAVMISLDGSLISCFL